MTRDRIVKELYEEYQDAPIMAQCIIRGDLTSLDYAYKFDRGQWQDVLKEVADKLLTNVTLKLMDYRVVQSVKCQFGSYNMPVENEDITMHSWPFSYYHGDIQKFHDSKGDQPGDLIVCSIDQIKFPLGMSLVQVSGKPAICYLWEEKTSGLYGDIEGNVYRRKLRHGLVLWVEDAVESHVYAKECMDRQESML